MMYHVILPKKTKDDLILWIGVDIGISVILIDNSGVNLVEIVVARGRNVSFPNWVICIEIAFS